MQPPKTDVLGTRISRTSFDDVMRVIELRDRSRALTINVCNVHSVMSARQDRELAAALAAGDINTPDGMPLVWFLKSLGFGTQTRVNGAELAVRAFAHGRAHGWRHFFYGATDDVLGKLRARLSDIEIAGMYAPPFRPLRDHERTSVLDTIRASRADIVWVGLGMPKQEKWMHDVRDALPGCVLVGIGAAFDFLAGTKPVAPRWMQDNGLEWAFRLASEPKRLWRRYAWNNPAFLALWLRQIASRRDARS